jgi:hypothetical protein
VSGRRVDSNKVNVIVKSELKLAVTTPPILKLIMKAVVGTTSSTAVGVDKHLYSILFLLKHCMLCMRIIHIAGVAQEVLWACVAEPELALDLRRVTTLASLTFVNEVCVFKVRKDHFTSMIVNFVNDILDLDSLIVGAHPSSTIPRVLIR